MKFYFDLSCFLDIFASIDWKASEIPIKCSIVCLMLSRSSKKFHRGFSSWKKSSIHQINLQLNSMHWTKHSTAFHKVTSSELLSRMIELPCPISNDKYSMHMFRPKNKSLFIFTFVVIVYAHPLHTRSNRESLFKFKMKYATEIQSTISSERVLTCNFAHCVHKSGLRSVLCIQSEKHFVQHRAKYTLVLTQQQQKYVCARST